MQIEIKKKLIHSKILSFFAVNNIHLKRKHMKRFFLLVFSLILSENAIFAQHIDTLSFYSEAFGTERSIYVQTPEFFP